MLVQLHVSFIHFLIAKQTIVHNALNCQFPIPLETLRPDSDAIRLSQLEIMFKFHFALI